MLDREAVLSADLISSRSTVSLAGEGFGFEGLLQAILWFCRLLDFISLNHRVRKAFSANLLHALVLSADS